MSDVGTANPERTVDAIVVGAGFCGIGMGVHLRRAGRDFVIIERADRVGGTWRDNTYPGAACDIHSHLYSLSFAPNPDWSRTFSPQREILAYLEQVVEAEELEPHIRFGAELTGARWDDDACLWRVETSRGPLAGRALVTASGHLSDPKMPDIAGLDSFAGTLFHSARWDHAYRTTGKRVGVIGTGASAIQVVPAIAPEVERLTVFQRSAPYVVPRDDRAYSEAERRTFRRLPATAQALRDKLFWDSEARFPQRLGVPAFIDEVKRIADEHRERQVRDPALRERLTPDYAIGCKRILKSDDYYPALQRDNVDLETGGIASITPTGVRTRSGADIPLDALIVCTGFEASDPPIAHRIRGRDGELLADHWRFGGQAYACTSVAGFPNLFVMLGPNTGLGAGSMIFMAETQMSYIVGALECLADDVTALEVTAETERAYVDGLDARSENTVWLKGGCQSWYIDPRSGRQTTLWPDFMSRFRAENGTFDASDYVARRNVAVAGGPR